MTFVAGSPLADDEPDASSRTMVDASCGLAHAIVNQLVDEASAPGDLAKHVSSATVSLDASQSLRPGPHRSRP